MSKRSARLAPTLGFNWVNAAGEQIASFTSLDARLKRAYQHLNELHSEIARVFDASNSDSMVVYNDDSKVGKRRIDVVNTIDTTTIALIAGDAIHNLRSVLNYLYVNLARFYATVQPFSKKEMKDIQFRAPKTAKLYKTKTRLEIKRFRRDVFKMLNTLYSDTRARRALWSLNHISNKDKHCALVGVGIKGNG